MANEILNIEFKFPIDHAGEWGSFGAKARELLAGTWEIYSVLSYGQAEPPFQTLYLIKEITFWKDRDLNQETLLSALIGRAIDTCKSGNIR
jgi:hypothetical protein